MVLINDFDESHSDANVSDFLPLSAFIRIWLSSFAYTELGVCKFQKSRTPPTQSPCLDEETCANSEASVPFKLRGFFFSGFFCGASRRSFGIDQDEPTSGYFLMALLFPFGVVPRVGLQPRPRGGDGLPQTLPGIKLGGREKSPFSTFVSLVLGGFR